MQIDPDFAADVLRRDESIKCKESFYYFCKYIFREVDPSKDFIEAPYTKVLCDHLEACYHRIIKRLVINIPPRHGKSTMVRVLFPAWVWLNNPTERFLATTYQRRLTIRDSKLLRKLITNKKFQQIVKDLDGENWEISKDVRTIEGWENTKRGSMHSYSIGATTGEGCDFLLIDDLMSVDMARSDTERMNAIAYYDGTLFSRIDRPDTGVKIIIMQRLHEWDLAGHVLNSKAEKWEHLVMAAEYEENARFKSNTSLGWVDDRQEGEILCPEITPREDLESKKLGMGDYHYSAQYRQDPVPEGGGIISASWWKETDLATMNARHGVFTIVSIDPAYSEKHEKTGSYTARVTLRVFREPFPDGSGYWHRVCLLGMRMERVGFPELVASTIKYCEEVEPQAILIENKATGKSLIQSIARKINRVVPFDPNKYGDKMERMSSIAPLVECGNCFYIPTHKASKEAVDMICRFPSDLMDVPDAFSQAMIYLEKMRLIKSPDDRDYETVIQPRNRPARGYGNSASPAYTYKTSNFKRRRMK